MKYIIQNWDKQYDGILYFVQRLSICREEILCLRTYSKGLDTWNEKVADLGRLLMRMSFR